MPGLLSKSALRSGGSGQYIKLQTAQPQLPPTPTTSTGYTVVTDNTLVTGYRSSLGNLEMNSGTIYSSTPDQSIKLLGTGTGTVLVLGGALSTSTNTGALQVIGGISSTQDIFVNGLTIGQGYQGVNNIVIRGVAQPIPNDADNGQESIAVGYDVLGGISSARATIAIGRGALSSGTHLVGQVAIGDQSLNSLGNFTVFVIGNITSITKNAPAVVTVANHGLTTGTVVTVTGLTQGPTALNGNNYWIDVVDLNNIVLYSDNILSVPLDTIGMPAYVNSGTLSRVLFYDENTALGANTGKDLIDGRQNLFLGPRAGQFLTTGSYNVFIGHEDANNMITGNANISINGGRLVDGLNDQISIGSTVYYDGNGNLSLLADTGLGRGAQSYGTDTGALIVSGGAGIQKDLWVGGIIHGQIDATSLSSALSGLSVLASTATSVTINDTTSTTSTPYFVVFAEQKNGNASPLDADTNVYYSTTNTTLTAPIFSATSGTTSTSTTTGDIVVTGGVGIGGDVNIGGVLTVAGDPGDIHGVRNVTADTVTATIGIYIAGTGTSTSTTTGALQVVGGIGTQGSVYSADGNVSEDNLLYTPRVVVGDIAVIQTVTPRVGDFWIDIGSNAQYQYIDDGGQRFWLQITQI
jgi:hypothetical protein